MKGSIWRFRTMTPRLPSGSRKSARARALLDSYKALPCSITGGCRRGTVVVEYARLPSRLVIFTADRSGVRATAVAVRARETDSRGGCVGRSDAP